MVCYYGRAGGLLAWRSDRGGTQSGHTQSARGHNAHRDTVSSMGSHRAITDSERGQRCLFFHSPLPRTLHTRHSSASSSFLRSCGIVARLRRWVLTHKPSPPGDECEDLCGGKLPCSVWYATSSSYRSNHNLPMYRALLLQGSALESCRSALKSSSHWLAHSPLEEDLAAPLTSRTQGRHCPSTAYEHVRLL